MAHVEIGPLSDRLDENEIKELARALKRLSGQLPKPGDEGSGRIGDGIDEDVMAEFLDRLEANDMACEIYLPSEFDGRVEIGELRVGSAPALLDVLEEIKDDLDIEDEDDVDDEPDDDEDADETYEEMGLIEEQLRDLWKLFHKAATLAVERSLPMYVSGA